MCTEWEQLLPDEKLASIGITSQTVTWWFCDALFVLQTCHKRMKFPRAFKEFFFYSYRSLGPCPWATVVLISCRDRDTTETRTRSSSIHSPVYEMASILYIFFSVASASRGKSFSSQLPLSPLAAAHSDPLTELLCEGACTAAGNTLPALPKLVPRAFQPFPTGQIAPQGWLLDQLLLQVFVIYVTVIQCCIDIIIIIWISIS